MQVAVAWACKRRPLGWALAAIAAVHAAVDAAPLTEPGLVSAWRTLRVVDCARCHGKDHDGWAAPSIVEYARSQTRERFASAVLDGDPGRGMPGYRSNPLVTERIDDLYRYFDARARGAIAAGDRAPLD